MFFSEVVGLVESVEMTKEYGEGKFKKHVKRFVVCNNETKRIRCIIWNENRIRELTPLIETGNVSL